MISVSEAYEAIMQQASPASIESVHFMRSRGRVLRESIISDRDLPPFDRVMMDGIAIRQAAFEAGIRNFKIQEIQAAGAPQSSLQADDACIEIMTGAILPENTDTVIRYEDVVIDHGIANVHVESIRLNQNVHHQGTDRIRGTKILVPGIIIGAAEIGVFASLGIEQVKVSKLPKCTIISTGDELVEVNEIPLAHQIRRSNVYMLQSQLESFGIAAEQIHLLDNQDHIRSQIKKLLEKQKILIVSGGVSKGKYDYLPTVLADLGVEKIFHKVKQRPGKPFWFGKHRSGVLVFALPGNPVSSFICLIKYVNQYLFKHLAADLINPAATLVSDFNFKPDLDYFLPVKLNYSGAQLEATPQPGHGSGDFANLLRADGFLHLPRGKEQFNQGEKYPLHLYRNPVL